MSDRGARKPSSLRLLEGKRSHRPIPEDAPTTPGIPPMPKSLTKAQREAWEEVVLRAPHGVITQSEGHLLEVTAIAIAKAREKGLGIYEALGWHKHVMQCLSKLGMTPVDRSKVGTQPKKPEKAADFPEGLRRDA